MSRQERSLLPGLQVPELAATPEGNARRTRSTPIAPRRRVLLSDFAKSCGTEDGFGLGLGAEGGASLDLDTGNHASRDLGAEVTADATPPRAAERRLDREVEG